MSPGRISLRLSINQKLYSLNKQFSCANISCKYYKRKFQCVKNLCFDNDNDNDNSIGDRLRRWMFALPPHVHTHTPPTSHTPLDVQIIHIKGFCFCIIFMFGWSKANGSDAGGWLKGISVGRCLLPAKCILNNSHDEWKSLRQCSRGHIYIYTNI